MHPPSRSRRVRPLATLVMLASLLAVVELAAGSDIVTTGGLAGIGYDAPQLYCAGVLTTEHTQSNPLACDAVGAGVGVTVLRLRVTGGAGHAYAWADDIVSQQFGFVDCRSTVAIPPPNALPDQTPGGRVCATAIGAGAGITGRFGLHFVADGPAGLAVEAQLERMDIPLP